MNSLTQLQISLLIACTFVINCGSNSGGSSQATSQSGPSEVTKGTFFTLEQGLYKAKVGGVEFQTNVTQNANNQPLLEQEISSEYTKLHIATQGKFYDAFAGVYNENDTNIQFYGIDGDVSSSITQDTTVNFQGAYTIADAHNVSRPVSMHPIDLSVNFETGDLNGETLNDENIQFSGKFEGTEIHIDIQDNSENYKASGHFFGPNNDEIAAGFEQEGVVGLIHAEQ